MNGIIDASKTNMRSHMPTRTTHQQQMIDIARQLAQSFAPRADAFDRTGTFPYAFYHELHQSGYLGFVVPQEFGGRGASLYDMVLCQEELAKGCGSTAMAVDMTIHVIGRIGEVRNYPADIYAQICHDIVANGALVNAVASEKDLGSPSRGGLPATTASWDGAQWRINGHKLFVSMAPALDYLITAVALPPTDTMPNGGTANAIVRGKSAGLDIIDTWSDALALRSSGSGDIIYRDVAVDDAWVIDRKALGTPAPIEPPTGMAWFALTLAAVYLGIGQAALDSVVDYAKNRIPTALGKPIATLPLIQRRLGEASIPLQAARALLHDVAATWSHDPSTRMHLGPRIAAAKYAATNAAVVATDHAMRAAGGFGITRDLPLERFFRDARAGLTHPPNDDAALELVGKNL
jgi:alkylation response protein AidB-like acyl-CoA dehydrogenase